MRPGAPTDPSVLPVWCGAPRAGERRKGALGVPVFGADAYKRRCPSTEVQFGSRTQKKQSYGLDGVSGPSAQEIKQSFLVFDVSGDSS